MYILNVIIYMLLSPLLRRNCALGENKNANQLIIGFLYIENREEIRLIDPVNIIH